jgi:hypothetical protein
MLSRVSKFIGNNLTHLSHQAHSSTWQQTLTIHPNNNRGTETQRSASHFDANGNLLTLDNIGTLNWHYNNTLNQLTKADKSNTTEYYMHLLLYSVGCAASGADKSTNFTGIFSITLPNISLIVLSEP